MPFLTDQGLGLAEISLLKGWVGNAMSIVGALAGGLLAFSTSRRNAVLISGVGQVASFMLYVRCRFGVGGSGVLWVATIAEGVLGTMATVALFALMMDASDPEHAGTDYTLLACVVIIVGMIANMCGGALADAFGYATAFTTGAILALAGCLTLVWVLDRYQFSSNASRSRGARRASRAPLHHRRLRQLNIEGRALAGPTLRPHSSADPLDRLAHQRQADARAGILVVAMQSLEDLEDVIVVFHLEADAIVGDAEHHAQIVATALHPDVRMLDARACTSARSRTGCAARAAVLPHRRAACIGSTCTDRSMWRRCTSSAYCSRTESISSGRCDHARLQAAPVDVRVRQQVVDQRRHAQRAVADARKVLARLRAQLAVHLRLEQVREAVDRAQRRFQIVRDCIGKAFELVIRALQLVGALAHALLERRGQLAVARFAQPQLDVRRLQLLVGRHILRVSCCDSFWIQASRAPRMIAKRMNTAAADRMTRVVSVLELPTATRP